MSESPKILFVTGKFAEPALRRVLADLGPKAGFVAEIAVLPITVAALMTAEWVGRKLEVPAGIDRVVLPGYVRGDVQELAARLGTRVELGPRDLRDLPEFFGRGSGPADGYGAFDIEILAEINHAPRLTAAALLDLARRHKADGADLIDLGCDPGLTWGQIGAATRTLLGEGMRVSVDSFDVTEVETALDAGAELVLSVNGSNAGWAVATQPRFPHAEFVAIPDVPAEMHGLESTIATLADGGVKFRIDPILEPIGFGFAASLGRYLEVRRRWPAARMMMGVGNLTELTDVDSSGINVLLAGFCQEQRIGSVLTTEVINWARSSVREFDLARRLVHYAVTHGVPPKRIDPRLVVLRDTKLYESGEDELRRLAATVADRNYRLFAERGELHALNAQLHVRGTDPFSLFEAIVSRDAKIDPSHAFYLGYEMAKAVTALTLSKNYTQDQALDWGHLTRAEASHRNPG